MNHLALVRLSIVLISFVSLVSCLSKTEYGEAGKAKVWSGVSYERQTVVEQAPAVSAAAAGWDSERAWSGFDDWEPAVAADPSSTYVYQLSTRYNGPKACSSCPFPVIIFRSSSNSGITWNADQFLAISKKKQNDPQIEVATDGTIYVVWLDEYNPGIKFIKSSNRGVSWTAPISFTGKGKKPAWSDKPILAISPNGQHVYIAFNSSDSYVVSSHNFGASFSSAVKTNNDTRYWFHNGGAVAPNGDVYFSAVDYNQDYTGDSNINVLKSTNGGASWTTTRVDTSKQMPTCTWAAGCYFGFLGPSAVLAIDGTGKIVLAYHAGDTAGAAQKMFVRTSTDGISWTARLEVSNGATGVNNAFPAISSTTVNGDFRLSWQDDRNGSTNMWNTWYRRSTNGGSTWSASVRISDLGSGAPYKSANGYRFPYGDYFELAVDATGMNHIIWGEGTSYDGPGGVWFTRGQ
jgi:hypothetical protein